MKAILNSKKDNSILSFGILLLLFLIALNFVVGDLKYFGLKEETFGRYWEIK
jgi:hypothetical protein